MLLTITLTQPPATDLGYMLHKSLETVHTRSLAFRPSHVFIQRSSSPLRGFLARANGFAASEAGASKDA